MEKNIKITAQLTNYILSIDEINEISIDYSSKTLDSKKLYEYIFKDMTESIVCNYDNDISSFFGMDEYNELDDEKKVNENKVIGEGKFIFEKIKELVDGILLEVNPLFQKDIKEQQE